MSCILRLSLNWGSSDQSLVSDGREFVSDDVSVIIIMTYDSQTTQFVKGYESPLR